MYWEAGTCHHVYFNPQNTDRYSLEYSPSENSHPVIVKMLGETYRNEAQYMHQLSLFFHSEEVEVATAAMQRLLNLLAKPLKSQYTQCENWNIISWYTHAL